MFPLDSNIIQRTTPVKPCRYAISCCFKCDILSMKNGQHASKSFERKKFPGQSTPSDLEQQHVTFFGLRVCARHAFETDLLVQVNPLIVNYCGIKFSIKCVENLCYYEIFYRCRFSESPKAFRELHTGCFGISPPNQST